MKKKHWIVLGVLVIVAVFMGSFIIKYIDDTAFWKSVEGGEDEQLVGGCAGVYYENWGECCDNWAEENGILHVQCVGNWTVNDDGCAWVCS